MHCHRRTPGTRAWFLMQIVVAIQSRPTSQTPAPPAQWRFGYSLGNPPFFVPALRHSYHLEQRIVPSSLEPLTNDWHLRFLSGECASQFDTPPPRNRHVRGRCPCPPGRIVVPSRGIRFPHVLPGGGARNNSHVMSCNIGTGRPFDFALRASWLKRLPTISTIPEPPFRHRASLTWSMRIWSEKVMRRTPRERT